MTKKITQQQSAAKFCLAPYNSTRSWTKALTSNLSKAHVTSDSIGTTTWRIT